MDICLFLRRYYSLAKSKHNKKLQINNIKTKQVRSIDFYLFIYFYLKKWSYTISTQVTGGVNHTYLIHAFIYFSFCYSKVEFHPLLSLITHLMRANSVRIASPDPGHFPGSPTFILATSGGTVKTLQAKT